MVCALVRVKDVIFDMPRQIVGGESASVLSFNMFQHVTIHVACHCMSLLIVSAGVVPAECPEFGIRPEHNPAEVRSLPRQHMTCLKELKT